MSRSKDYSLWLKVYNCFSNTQTLQTCPTIDGVLSSVAYSRLRGQEARSVHLPFYCNFINFTQRNTLFISLDEDRWFYGLNLYVQLFAYIVPNSLRYSNSYLSYIPGRIEKEPGYICPCHTSSAHTITLRCTLRRSCERALTITTKTSLVTLQNFMVILTNKNGYLSCTFVLSTLGTEQMYKECAICVPRSD